MENQDSEPLFGDDVYSLLRDDSLLHRTGSNNFASLIESMDTVVAGSSLHQEIQRQHNIHQNEHIQPVQKNIGTIQLEQQPMDNQQCQQQQKQDLKQEPKFQVLNIDGPRLQQQQEDIKQEPKFQVLNIDGPRLQQQQEDIKQEPKYQVLNIDGPRLQQQQQQQQQQHQQEPQPQEIKPEQCVVYRIQDYSNGKIVLISNDPSPSVSNEQQVQPQEQQPMSVAWDAVDDEDSVTEVPTTTGNFVSNPSNSFTELLDEASSYLPDTTARGVPSLQPWPGKYLFGISLPVDNKDRNKWCYSQELKKLYVCPGVAVPVNITLSKWIDASITITPVFHQSQYRMDPVIRCYNCKNANNCDPQLVDYIVQVDGEGCSYEVMQERPIVRVPVQQPSPGERSSILLLKLMCLTSCVGGPNRRPYCLVLTLRCNLTGMEIGRQILDVKCCKCPSRDMTNDATSNKTKLDDGQATKIRKLSSQITVGQKRKKPKVKNEPGIETRYVNIAVPVEFELQVKSYVNGLIAEQILRRNQPNLLLYPEDDN